MTDVAPGRHLTTVDDDAPPPPEPPAYEPGPADWEPTRQPTSAHQPPHDRDAERATIGAALSDRRALDDISLVVQPTDFYDIAHELIYDAITTLYAQTRPVDKITVANHLGKDLERAGGRSYLEHLTTIGIGVIDATWHAQIVAEQAALRRLQQHHLKGLAEIETRGDSPAAELYQRTAERLEQIPLGVPGVEHATTSTYARLDLTDVIADVLSGSYTGPRAEILSRRDGKMLLYPKGVHSISGEPGSAKSWCALIAAAQQLNDGQPVAFMDFEDNSHPVVMRLVNLGVDPAAILEHFRYVRPQHAFGASDTRVLDAEVADCGLAVIDGITEAMTINGLSPNDNDDVANWLHLLPNRIADQGPAVLQVDHVVKNAEQRGRYAIGGQHKLAGITGAAYKAVVVKPFAKGSAGHSKIVIDKDKHGDVGPVGLTVADLHVDATDTSGRVYAWLDAPEKSTDEEGHFRPTVLMGRVSDFLLGHVGPASMAAIQRGVKGKAESIVEAVDALVREGHVRVENGPRGALLHHLVEVFEER